MTTNDPIKADARDGVGVPAAPSGHPSETEPSSTVSAQSVGVPNVDYQRGIDAARAATFHILRLFEVSDDLFYSVASATYQLRGREMPLAGAMPVLTDVERELGAAKNRGILDAIAMPPEGPKPQGSGASAPASASGTDRPNDTTEAP